MKIARIIDDTSRTCYCARQDDGTLLRIAGDPFAPTAEVTGEVVRADRWLPPIDPRAILCIGKNYAEHAAEMASELPEYPLMFMKNPSAAIGHGEAIVIPKVCDDEVDYEGELAVIIGKAARDVSRAEALDHVLGYACANDVSARIWQKQKGGGQWNRGKGFDTFAPLGPVLVTADALPNPSNVSIRTTVNGEVRQESNTSSMMFDVPHLIEFLSQDTTLQPLTIILTGTPSGVGWARDPKLTLQPGDEVAVGIAGIGELVSPVQAAS
jgi:2-keto-4-pentenoate hydratase/2-oxohepta-3-ene-1,7-dioic acid hydratase in catechol pathway